MQKVWQLSQVPLLVKKGTGVWHRRVSGWQAGVSREPSRCDWKQACRVAHNWSTWGTPTWESGVWNLQLSQPTPPCWDRKTNLEEVMWKRNPRNGDEPPNTWMSLSRFSFLFWLYESETITWRNVCNCRKISIPLPRTEDNFRHICIVNHTQSLRRRFLTLRVVRVKYALK